HTRGPMTAAPKTSRGGRLVGPCRVWSCPAGLWTACQARGGSGAVRVLPPVAWICRSLLLARADALPGFARPCCHSKTGQIAPIAFAGVTLPGNAGQCRAWLDSVAGLTVRGMNECNHVQETVQLPVRQGLDRSRWAPVATTRQLATSTRA